MLEFGHGGGEGGGVGGVRANVCQAAELKNHIPRFSFLFSLSIAWASGELLN